MISKISQSQREALALCLLDVAPSQGATIFQVRQMAHAARWGGSDGQILRKLREMRQGSKTLVFCNAFGIFIVPVATQDEENVGHPIEGKSQNERLYRVFLRQMSRQL